MKAYHISDYQCAHNLHNCLNMQIKKYSYVNKDHTLLITLFENSNKQFKENRKIVFFIIITVDN